MTRLPTCPTADPSRTRACGRRRCATRRRARRRCSTPRSCGARVGDSFVKLDPRQMARNPVMFVVEIGSVLTTILFFQKLPSATRVRQRVHRPRVGVAVVHRAVRQLRRGGGRGPGQGAGRHAAQDALGDRRPRPPARRHRRRRSRRASCTVGDECVVPAGELIPGDGDDHRGHRVGRRVGDHRRVGAGDPRVGRRPLGGHRRHPRALRPDRRADHVEAGRDVPRPHDRARRRAPRARRHRTRSRSTSCSPA